MIPRKSAPVLVYCPYDPNNPRSINLRIFNPSNQYHLLLHAPYLTKCATLSLSNKRQQVNAKSAFFVLALPCRLVAWAYALLGMVNVQLLLLFL
jgi:hypothetical protein